ASAYQVAADLFDRAIELWAKVPDPAAVAGVDLATLYERAADAIYRGQHGPRAEELARRALTLIDAAAQPERVARLHLLAGVARCVRYGVDRTIGMALRAMVAGQLVENGRWVEADRFSAEALAADGNPRLWALRARAELEIARGHLDAAQALLDELLPLAD